MNADISHTLMIPCNSCKLVHLSRLYTHASNMCRLRLIQSETPHHLSIPSPPKPFLSPPGLAFATLLRHAFAFAARGLRAMGRDLPCKGPHHTCRRPKEGLWS